MLDVGYSDLFITNAKAFGINLEEIDAIAVSHGHDDHTRGLKYFFKQVTNRNLSIYGHPDTFNKKELDGMKICSPLSVKELKDKCNLILGKNPIKISNNLTFLGEIPQINSFEERLPIGKQAVNNTYMDDYVMDDSALFYKSEKGIYIITGCSHSGICNIIEYAKQVSGDNRVLGIIGGFHLFDEKSNRVKKTIEYIKDNNIAELYPCHCTSFAVKAEMNKIIPVREVGVGLELNWD